MILGEVFTALSLSLPTENEKKEQRASIDAILASTCLPPNADKQRAVLRHLFRCHLEGRKASALEIAADVLQIEVTAEKDDSAARWHCTVIRTALQNYELAHKDDDGWHVSLPSGRSGGYALRFWRRGHLSATEAFWAAHLRPEREVLVVCNEPVFFRSSNPAEPIFRYPDVNTWITDRSAAVRELRHSHP